MALPGSKTLVGPGVELLRRNDLQGVVVLPLNGDVLIRDYRLRVPVPVDGVFRRAFHSAGEEQCAADACFQILRRQGHPQWI